jgi:heme exporter protein A
LRSRHHHYHSNRLDHPLTQPLLEFRGVYCERADAPLFAPLSFAVEAGALVQLEGANGVGKTSLLRCVAGLSSRWQGELQWCGAPLAERRIELAAASVFLGHSAGLKAVLSPRENLLWWAGLRGLDIDREADAALARAGLAGYEDAPCYQLSAGQQRRAALARLFVARAPLWILDEPFTAIDRRGSAELEGWLAAHADGGGAVLFTTHQPLSLDRPLLKVALQPPLPEAGHA